MHCKLTVSPIINIHIHASTKCCLYRIIFEAELEKRKENVAEENKGEDLDLANNKVFGEGLGVFCSGLFGFYQYAAFEIKEKFLDIVEDLILSLTKEVHV